MVSSRLTLSSSLEKAVEKPPRPAAPTLSNPRSKPPPISNALIAAAVDGLSKLSAPVDGWPIKVDDVAGDFLTCCGDDRGPRGEKAACAGLEKGVETGGVAPASWEGVRPCCEGPCFIGVGVAMAAMGAMWRFSKGV